MFDLHVQAISLLPTVKRLLKMMGYVLAGSLLLMVIMRTVNSLIWFGHSAFLLHLDGKNILIDPMLGQHPSPSPLVGTKRFTEKLPILIPMIGVPIPLNALIYDQQIWWN